MLYVFMAAALVAVVLLILYFYPFHASTSTTKNMNMNTSSSITKEQARSLAEKECCGFLSSHEFVIVDEWTEERTFGWVFGYATKKYLETKDPNELIPGSAPIIVTREGEVVPLTSAGNPSQQIASFEKEWQAKQAASMAEYEKIQRFAYDKVIRYPDFSIEYVGQHSADGIIRVDFYDFTVTDASGIAQDVSWTAGTGDIGPASFTVGKKTFMLELKRSVVVEKPLPSDSFIITPAEEWGKYMQQQIQTTNTQADNVDYVVFTKEQAEKDALGAPSRGSGYFTPVESQVKIAQTLIRASKPLDKYYQQYVGGISKENGHHIIYLYGLLKSLESSFPEWRTTIMHMMDGGDGFLDAAVDLDTNELLFAEFHGEA